MSKREPTIRVRLIVAGRVQGVFFRAATAQMARTLGGRGVARNLLDGTVEIVVEGTQSSLQSLIEWAHKGPPEARVDEVRAEWSEATGEFRGFEIR